MKKKMTIELFDECSIDPFDIIHNVLRIRILRSGAVWVAEEMDNGDIRKYMLPQGTSYNITCN